MMLRPLTPPDAEVYVSLRREMLADAPWAFAASVDDDDGLHPDRVRALVQRPDEAILGAFAPDGTLLAVAGIGRERLTKRRHIAHLWGVYVTPSARGRRLGRDVVLAAVTHARGFVAPPVAWVQLSVSEHSPAAQKVYESLGFVAWGRELDAFRTADIEGHPELHMALKL